MNSMQAGWELCCLCLRSLKAEAGYQSGALEESACCPSMRGNGLRASSVVLSHSQSPAKQVRHKLPLSSFADTPTKTAQDWAAGFVCLLNLGTMVEPGGPQKGGLITLGPGIPLERSRVTLSARGKDRTKVPTGHPEAPSTTRSCHHLPNSVATVLSFE